jgi:hypothetical protein
LIGLAVEVAGDLDDQAVALARMRKPRSAPAISMTESMMSSRSFLRLCSELMSLLMSSIR